MLMGRVSHGVNPRHADIQYQPYKLALWQDSNEGSLWTFI